MALDQDLLSEVFRVVSQKKGSFNHVLACRDWSRAARNSLEHVDAKLRLPELRLPEPDVIPWYTRLFRAGLPLLSLLPASSPPEDPALEDDEHADLSGSMFARAGTAAPRSHLRLELQQFPRLRSLSIEIQASSATQYPDLIRSLCSIVASIPNLKALEVMGLKSAGPYDESEHVQGLTRAARDLVASELVQGLLSSCARIEELLIRERVQVPLTPWYSCEEFPKATLDAEVAKLAVLKKLDLDSLVLVSVAPQMSLLTSLTSLSVNIPDREHLAGVIIRGLPQLRHLRMHTRDAHVIVTSRKLVLQAKYIYSSHPKEQQFATAAIDSIAGLPSSTQWAKRVNDVGVFLEDVDCPLPDSFFSAFCSLRTLRLHSGALHSLPESLHSCAWKLRCIELHAPNLRHLPSWLCPSQRLRELDLCLDNCATSTLAPLLDGRESVQKLSIREMAGLTELCSSAEKWTNLQELTLAQCPHLRVLPAGLHKLSSLRRLRLTQCGQLQVKERTQHSPGAALISEESPFVSELEELVITGSLGSYATQELPPALVNARKLKILRLRSWTASLPRCSEPFRNWWFLAA